MTSLMSMLLARPFRVVDLTMPLNPATPSPVEPGVEQRVLRRHGDPAPEGAPQYKITWFGMNDHCGTHMDAPSHFIPDGPGIDRADIEAFCLMPAIRLDLAPGSLFQRIDASDILAALDAMNARLKAKGEESLGMPPKQSLILLHTGHDRHVGFPEYGQAPFLTPRACRPRRGRQRPHRGRPPRRRTAGAHAAPLPGRCDHRGRGQDRRLAGRAFSGLGPSPQADRSHRIPCASGGADRIAS